MSEGEVPRGRATIRDVAARAGVSISTVSHALSGRRTISAATKERIMSAAEELGYGANPSARALRTGRSGLVGLILRPRDAVHGSMARTETFTRLLGAMATAVLEQKMGLVHVPDILDPAVQGIPMDGCIVAHPYRGDEVLGQLLRRDIPVVTVDEDTDRPDFPWCVVLDTSTAVAELLQHLQDNGARRVMLLTGTEDNAWNRHARETYLAWAKRRRMKPHHESLYEGEGVDGAAKLIEPILTGPRRPDAIVAAPSRFAAGIAQTAEKLGIDMPGDLMLAALTDSEYTRGNTPPITSVDLALEELGMTTVALMLQRLAGDPPPVRRPVVQPRLYVRRSTTLGPAAS